MNTLQGVFQKLYIIDSRDSRLVLRELPLLDWSLAFLLLLAALIFLLVDFLITAGIGFAIAFLFVLQSRIRLIVFTTQPNLMQVIYRTAFRSEIVKEISLHQMSRAYLKKDDGGSQIILVMSDGEEMGLSVYAHDMNEWKEEIVIAVNAILHNAHKDDPNRDGMV